MPRRYIATFAVLGLALIGLNVFAAVRDNNGMRCYAQPVSEICN